MSNGHEPVILSSEAIEYIEARIKEQPNLMEIVREVVKYFNFPADRSTALRTKISRIRRKQLETIKPNFKRLFFDIETTPCLGWFWRPTFKAVIKPNQIIEYAKIICISWKWADEEKVHNLTWSKDQNDKEMLEQFIKVMNEADECIAHNGDRFDEKWIRTRCVYHSINAMPKYKTLDTLKKAKAGFMFPSNRLDEIGKYLGVGRKIQTAPELWEKVWQQNDRKALKEMVQYCDQDVILLEDVFNVLNPYILGNVQPNTTVDKDRKWRCPECYSGEVELVKTPTTAMGTIIRWMECTDCNKNYKINKKSYENYWHNKTGVRVKF